MNKLTKIILSASMMAMVGFTAITSGSKALNAEAASNYTIVDTDQEDLEYQYLYGQNDATETDGFYSIVGFDTLSSVSQIDRLTLKVSWRTWSNWDPFHWGKGEEHTKTFFINATDTIEIFGAEVASNGVEVMNVAQLALFDLPMIGTSGDLMDFNNYLESYPEFDLNDVSGYTKSYCFLKDNGNLTAAGGWNKLDETGLVSKMWYLVIPVAYSYEEVWISIAGYDTNGEKIDDGTGHFDVFGFYVPMNSNTANSANFTSVTTVSYIAVKDYAGTGNITLYFGNYNYEENEFDISLRTIELTGNSFESYFFSVPYDYEVVVIMDETVTAGTVKMYYYAPTSPVLSNIVNEDGQPQPITNDPEQKTPWDLFLEWLNKAWDSIKTFIFWSTVALGAIAVLALGVYLFFNNKQRRTQA